LAFFVGRKRDSHETVCVITYTWTVVHLACTCSCTL